MNISLQNVDKVSALLTLKLEKADYQARVEKTLKTYRQKANIPGFRPGMVPMSLIKKQFGKSVLVEEVDKMMQEKVNEYIRDNKVNMLGMPLPNEEKMKPIDFDTQEDLCSTSLWLLNLQLKSQLRIQWITILSKFQTN